MYSDTVMDHFYNPRNAGRMVDPTVIGRAGKVGRGNFMLLYLKINVDKITQAMFQTYGCCPAIAAGSLLTERLEGLNLNEAIEWTSQMITDALGGLPKHKKHCSQLAADALSDALGALA